MTGPRHESWVERWSRRAVSFTGLLVVWLLLVGSLVALPALGAVDLASGSRWARCRALLWDPCLDVVGQRLPNVLARPRPARELAPVARRPREVEALCTR